MSLFVDRLLESGTARTREAANDMRSCASVSSVYVRGVQDVETYIFLHTEKLDRLKAAREDLVIFRQSSKRSKLDPTTGLLSLAC